MSRPPVSKVTPLPTSVILGVPRIAPGQIEQARRLGAGPADGVDQREVLRRAASSPTIAVSFMRWRVAKSRISASKASGPEVVGRRVDEVAGEKGRIGEARRLRRHRRRLARRDRGSARSLAVAIEAVGAEAKAEHGARRIADGRHRGGKGPAASAAAASTHDQSRTAWTVPKCRKAMSATVAVIAGHSQQRAALAGEVVGRGPFEVRPSSARPSPPPLRQRQ